MHSHDSGVTEHRHNGGNFPHRHEDPANLARLELLTQPDPGFVPEPPTLSWESTPTLQPQPATDNRVITEEREGSMWNVPGWLTALIGILVGFVLLAFLVTVFPLPQIVDLVDNGDVNTAAVGDKVVATDQGFVASPGGAGKMIFGMDGKTYEVVPVQPGQATVVPNQPDSTAPPAAQAPAATSAPSSNSSSSADIGSVNDAPAYGNDPELYVPHPLSYQETGVQGTVSWKIEVLSETTLIVGGWSVDGQDGGVYKAIHGPKTVSVKVADGFYSIVPDQWAQSEWDFRIGEAVKYGWAHAHETPPTW